jgi:hypothetical protein
LDARRVAKLYAVEPLPFSVNLCAYYACSCDEALISSFVLKDDKDNIQLSAVEDHDRILMPVRLAARRLQFRFNDVTL